MATINRGNGIHLRCMASAWETNDLGERVRAYPPEWMKVIHEANRLADDKMFGRPTFLGEWWAGGSVEEYPDARVLHRGDGTVSIVSKTTHGSDVLRQVAKNLGIYTSDVETAIHAVPGQYVTGANGDVHIVYVDNDRRALCGRTVADTWVLGDETANAIAATCDMCKSIFKNGQPK